MTRIGTWNLQGRSTPRQMALQREFMARADCDVWLLSEVSHAFAGDVVPHTIAASQAMGADKAFAAVLARDGLTALPAIHEAAAFATVGELRVCSCVLPWRGAASQGWPAADGVNLSSITQNAIGRLRAGLADGSGELVWGGDFNQALEGADSVGTPAGRSALNSLFATLGLKVPTAGLAHGSERMRSIDHIAVPKGWNVSAAARLVAAADGARLSDHDAYVIDVEH